MASSSSDSWNVQFFDTYDTIRRYLRPVSYGCFAPRDVYELLGSRASSYSHVIQHLRECLPDGSLRDIDGLLGPKNQRVQIAGDSYRMRPDPFAETYLLHSLKTYDVFLLLHLLRYLRVPRTPKERQPAKIVRRINGEAARLKKAKADESAPADFDAAVWTPSYSLGARLGEKGIDTRSVQSALETLAAAGYVRREGTETRPGYAVADDVLQALDARETQALRFAVDFYKERAPLQAPGFFLSATLGCRCGRPEEELRPFQFVGGDARRIIDDDIVYKILQARERHEDIAFLYRDPQWQPRDDKRLEEQQTLAELWGDALIEQKRRAPGRAAAYRQAHPRPHVRRRYVECRPVAIRIDDLAGGRQQLVDNKGRAYRLEDIRSVRPRRAQERSSAPPPATRALTFLLHARDAAHADALCRSVQHHLRAVAITREAGCVLRCTMRCPKDLRKELPLLREYLPYIEILATDAAARDLRRRMKESIEEALRNYEVRS